MTTGVIVIATQLHSLLWVARILAGINLFSFAQLLLDEQYALTWFSADPLIQATIGCAKKRNFDDRKVPIQSAIGNML